MSHLQVNEREEISKLLHKLEEQPLWRFPQARQSLEAPKLHGVYVIRDRNKKVAHVGRTVRGKGGLAQRLKNHLAAQSSFVQQSLAGNGSKLRLGYTYQYIEVPDDRKRALLEFIATAWHCPEHLGLGSAVELRM